MAKYHGKKGRVMMSTSGSTAAVTVASLSAWSLDMATDRVEVTAFGDANKTYVQGLPDISGQISGFYDDTVDTLFTGADSADGVNIYLYPSTDDLTSYWYGPAFVDFSISTGVSEAVTISGSFAARGSWGRN